MRKLRMLWHSVSPFIRSGYGKVTYNITSRLAKLGYQVIISAYYGVEPGGMLEIGGCSVVSSKEGSFGVISAAKYAKMFKTDIQVLHTDWWAFPQFPKLMSYPVLYSPMDHINYPEEIMSFTREYKQIISLCEWQRRNLKEKGIETPVIPHGVDLSIYKPLSKEKCKELYGVEDKFVFGTVAANCFDEETEILTKEGWKRYYELTPDDEYLVLDRDGVMRYYKADGLIIQHYKGKMYRLKTKYLDFLVTPSHKMYVKRRRIYKRWREQGREKSYEFTPYYLEEARELFGKQRWYKKDGGEWIGEYKEYFVLPEYSSIMGTSKREYYQPAVKIRMDVFLKLLGYYISEGYATDNSVFICQVKHTERMKEELKGLPFEVKDYGDKLAVHNTALAKWFKENVGTNAFDKRIPKEFKMLCKEQLEILWEAMCLGDGFKTSSSWAYSTSSKQLAGDVQEILIKMGDGGDITVKRQHNDHYVKGRLLKASACRVNYIIHRNKVVKEVQNRGSGRKRGNLFVEEWVDYDGVVWDPVMPHYPVMVRRNGKVAWSGRSDKEDRKAHTRMMKAMYWFLENNPDVRKDIVWLYHTVPNDPKGLPLDKICRKWGLKDVVRFMDPSLSTIYLTEEQMAVLYNAMDTHLLCSKREGFGLPILESMACGVPNICHDFSSMTELVKGRGWLVKSLGTDLNLETTPLNAETAVPDVYDIADKIARAFFKDKERERYSKRARAFALKFNWDDLVMYKWHPLLQGIAERLFDESAKLKDGGSESFAEIMDDLKEALKGGSEGNSDDED